MDGTKVNLIQNLHCLTIKDNGSLWLQTGRLGCATLKDNDRFQHFQN